MARSLRTQCLACDSRHIACEDARSDLFFCADCGFAFVNPQPTLVEVQQFYSAKDKYQGWIDDTLARDQLWRRRLRKITAWAEGTSILDVGTGTGQFLHHAKRHFSEISGTELSTSGIRVAAEKYGLDIIHGNLESITFDRSFDNISMFHLLEHVHEPRMMLAKCHELLKPDGRLFIAVPNDLQNLRLKIRTVLKRLLKNEPQLAYGLPPLVLDGSVAELHLSQFTTKSLVGLLERTGFVVEEISLDPFFVSSGIKTLQRKSEYLVLSLFYRATGLNVYDAIWAVARKAD